MTRWILGLVITATGFAQSAQISQLTSFQAFQRAAIVLRHPRCVNCHIGTDQPLIGEKGEVHPMRVARGADGQGTPALRCSACHQETNGELPHSPPGSKGWQLPSPEDRRPWAGMDDQKMCRGILAVITKDGLNRETIVSYVGTDPRVLWSWDPGPGREKPPMDRLEFAALIRTWIEKGASCAP